MKAYQFPLSGGGYVIVPEDLFRRCRVIGECPSIVGGTVEAEVKRLELTANALRAAAADVEAGIAIPPPVG